MGIRLYLPNVRISYPHLFQPRAVRQGDTPKFGCQLLIPVNAPAYPENQIPGNSLVEQLWNARHKIVQDEMGGIAPTNPQKELPCKQGDLLVQQHPEYAGFWVLSANSTTAPHVVDENVQPVMDQSKIYAGCFVNASIGLFVYDNMGKGIAAGLNGVQFARDGERLDGRPAAGDLFQAIPGAPTPVATPPGYHPGAMGAPAQPPGYGQPLGYGQPAPMMGVPGQPAAPAAPQYPGQTPGQGWTP